MLTSAAHAGSLDLSQYKATITSFLGHDRANMQQVGVAEASTVTYDWDRGSLMVLGDEGAGGNEYDLNGYQYPGIAGVRATVTATRGNLFFDSEGITYVGNGEYIVAEERTTNLIKTHIDPSRTIVLPNGKEFHYFSAPDAAYTYTVSGGPNWGNTGLEGVSYDPITGGLFGIKSANGQRVMFIDWDFNTANSGGTTTDLFDASRLGLTTLSDIATLSTVDAFDGADFRDNLLILSASSRRLLEVTRAGDIVSSLDLSNYFTDETNTLIDTIEGVTLDKDGNIYLVGEGDVYFSHFIKLERQPFAAVPEPATWAMMIGGFGLVGGAVRRRAAKAAFA